MTDAWDWTAAEVRAYVEAAGLGARAEAVRLTGGLLNVVWRVPAAGPGASVIAKIAPPFVAALPDVPLAQSRQRIEAAALAAFAVGGALAAVPGVDVRPPGLLYHDAGRHVLLMEDVGDLPDLGRATAGGIPPAGGGGEALGRFLGRLHAVPLTPALRSTFDNAGVQRTRLAVQYRSVAAALRSAGVADADALGGEAVALGERLLEPGRCLIHGDLWPASVLTGPDGGLRVIDWELAHAGVPAQDLGHLGAHLWMVAHRRPEAAPSARALWAGVLQSYAEGAGEALPSLLEGGTLADAARHFGCEILVRAAGPFQGGSLYDGLPPSSAAVREAAAVAADALLDPSACREFDPLR